MAVLRMAPVIARSASPSQTKRALFPTSLDVSDKGYVLVGTQDRRKKISAVTLYTASGAVARNKTFGDDDNAYRPDVQFAPNGSGFFVRDRAGISFFAMVNP